MPHSSQFRLKTLCFLAPLLILSPAAAAAATGPEAGLRASSTLSAGEPIAEIDRTLLRLEQRSGQLRLAESEMLGEMTSRMENMGRTIAELHALISAAPAPAPATAIAAPCVCEPVPEVPPPAPANNEWPWLEMALVAIVSLLLGFLLRRPRRAPAEPLTRQETASPQDRTLPPPATGRRPAPPPVTQVPVTGPPPVDDTISDAELSLELADVMVSMGLEGGAVQTLEGHIRQHPRHALFHWLKLLEVYRRFGQQEEFERAARELQQHFNIAPPTWQPTAAGPGAPSLEDYPHISAHLQELWRQPSCAEYLNHLLEDNRDGSRTGFPSVVVDEILLLMELLRN